jgi:ferrous iron transport protein B
MEEITEKKTPLISLVGAPNSGKTTLFNYLSGKNYKTVNYPGSTVEYSFAPLLEKFNLTGNILDTPGIISLNPASPDEKVAISSLYYHPDYGSPDVVLVSVDSSQLSRHLLLVQQMLRAHFNIIVVLTMGDILERKGFQVSEDALSKRLKCGVVRINGKTGAGVPRLMELIELSLSSKKTESKFNDPEFDLHHKLHEEFHHQHERHHRRNGDSSNHRRRHFSLLHLLSFFFAKRKCHDEGAHNHGNHRSINDLEKLHGVDPELLRNSHKLIHIFHEIEKIESEVLVRIDGAESSDKQKSNFNAANNQPDSFTIKIDSILLHKYWGLLFFVLIMAATFTSILWLASPIMDLINIAFSSLSQYVSQTLGDGWLSDLLANGLIDGVGSVLVFLPQIIILFLILGLLEDSGYLARGAMLVDRPLSKIGLNGKSFVPMLSGFACAIPATLAARTISNKRERFLTIFILPLMTCSARLPVYALLIAFVTPQNKPWIGGLLLATIYVFGILNSCLISGIINKFLNRGRKEVEDDSSFILELPTYKRPVFSIVATDTYNNAKQYIKRAGPIILTLSLVIWLITYFPNSNPKVDETNKTRNELVQLKNSERLENSYSAYLGKFIEPVMRPLGLDWRVGTALVSTFAAREVFVSSLAVIFKVTSTEDKLQNSILKQMREATIGNTGQKLFTTATIAGLIVFFIFALQCISTIAISKKETGGWRIPSLQIAFYTITAYLFSFLTVNGLRALGIQ